MMKTLTLATFLSASFLLIIPLAAQELSEAPNADGGAPVTQAAPSTVYNSGVGPINLRPRAYVGHATTAEKPATPATRAVGTKSYPVKATSTQAYNQRMQGARSDRLSNGQPRIPSPFPEGW